MRKDYLNNKTLELIKIGDSIGLFIHLGLNLNWIIEIQIYYLCQNGTSHGILKGTP